MTLMLDTNEDRSPTLDALARALKSMRFADLDAFAEFLDERRRGIDDNGNWRAKSSRRLTARMIYEWADNQESQ